MERKYLLSGIACLVILIADYVLFRESSLFYFIMGLAFALLLIPWILSIVTQSNKDQAINEMFLEFSRNLAESVNTGTPISKSIINMKNKNYGPLSPHVEKLANQIALGIPVNKALHVFAAEIGSSVISRAVALISEAERAGGQIDYILASVAQSISEVEKLKKERKAAISNLVVQGYIIFFIFIGIMLVMEYKILPLTGNIGSFGAGVSGGGFSGGNIGDISNQQAGTEFSPEQMARPFLFLLLAQGFFAGLTIGKLTEGKIRAGVKHSFILTIAAFLIETGVRAFFGS